MPRVHLTSWSLDALRNSALRKYAADQLNCGSVVWAYVTDTLITVVSDATRAAQGKPASDVLLRVGPWNQRWQAVEITRRSNPSGSPPAIMGLYPWHCGVTVGGMVVKIGLLREPLQP
jgi:hypothetical protein